MEYAEDNLAQILPHRALTPEEVRDLLEPALDALTYLAWQIDRAQPAEAVECHGGR